MSARRRDVLRIAAGAVLLPLASGQAWAERTGRFAPPPQPMRYTRRLERTMMDGAVLTVSRVFAIRFLTVSGGYRVEGDQVDVTVEAPAKLAPFAALERARVEQGLFPLLLDADGLIHGARPPVRTAELDAAVAEALARYRDLPQAPLRDEAVQFVNALHQGASKLVTELPNDLFAPHSGARTASRDVALPDGESGAVTVRFSALADPATGLMREAMREVVTALSEDRRRTVETWQLVPF